MAGEPYPKSSQFARGPKRKPRSKATGDEWREIVAAKGRTCRCLRPTSLCNGPIEYHHLISRARLGDDVADNIVPLCRHHHLCVTAEWPDVLATLAASLTDAEYAYVVGKLGESGMERLFGVGRDAR